MAEAAESALQSLLLLPNVTAVRKLGLGELKAALEGTATRLSKGAKRADVEAAAVALWRRENELKQILPPALPVKESTSETCCDGCGKVVGEDSAPNPVDERTLCSACAYTMSRTSAKELYARVLTDEVLDTLPCVSRTNPHRRSGPPMRLYLACDLSGVVEANPSLKRKAQREAAGEEERAMKKRARAEAAGEREKTRREELEAALEAQGCTLRRDSALCSAYISGCPKPGYREPEAIARRMAEMRYLHNHTRYSDIMHEKWQEAKRELGWIKEDDKEMIRDMAESRAIGKSGYPAVWPWQQ
mmetsp:Transcript_5627/g.19277  ORF Transcript_5627/g.19277 Transcript_5627/m.19277 type:complete len:303 (+) Transcript_5627:1281-2189(+)